MAVNRVIVEEVEPGIRLKRVRPSDLVLVENGKTGNTHSIHPSIAASGSIKGMQKQGYWKKGDKLVRFEGAIYNMSKYSLDPQDKWDMLALRTECPLSQEAQKEAYELLSEGMAHSPEREAKILVYATRLYDKFPNAAERRTLVELALDRVKHCEQIGIAPSPRTVAMRQVTDAIREVLPREARLNPMARYYAENQNDNWIGDGFATGKWSIIHGADAIKLEGMYIFQHGNKHTDPRFPFEATIPTNNPASVEVKMFGTGWTQKEEELKSYIEDRLSEALAPIASKIKEGVAVAYGNDGNSRGVGTMEKEATPFATPEALREALVEALPSGSGFNTDWEIEVGNEAVHCKSVYDHMNEVGMYDGNIPFEVILPAKDPVSGLKVEIHALSAEQERIAEEDDLKTYIGDEVAEALQYKVDYKAHTTSLSDLPESIIASTEVFRAQHIIDGSYPADCVEPDKLYIDTAHALHEKLQASGKSLPHKEFDAAVATEMLKAGCLKPIAEAVIERNSPGAIGNPDYAESVMRERTKILSASRAK